MKNYVVICSALSLFNGLARKGEKLDASQYQEDFLNQLVEQGKVAVMDTEADLKVADTLPLTPVLNECAPITEDGKEGGEGDSGESFVSRLAKGLGPLEGWDEWNLDKLTAEEKAELLQVKSGEIPYRFDGAAVEALTVKEILAREAALSGGELKTVKNKAEAIQALQNVIKEMFVELTVTLESEPEAGA